MPVDQTAVSDVRILLAHLGAFTKSRERTRRPTASEIHQLCEHFRAKGSRQRVPMVGAIQFTVATAIRLGEINRLEVGRPERSQPHNYNPGSQAPTERRATFRRRPCSVTRSTLCSASRVPATGSSHHGRHS